MIEKLLLVVLYGLFAQGFRGVRRGSLALAVALALLYALGPVGSLHVLAALIVVYAATGGLVLLGYATLISSIPAAWMAVTQLVLDAASGWQLEPLRYPSIALRSLSASLLALYLLHSVNPLEVGYAVYRATGSCTLAYAIPFIQKVVGQFLRESSEAVASHRLKGVGVWRTLALMLVRSSELITSIEEGVSLRLSRCSPRLAYSGRVLAAQALGLAVAATLAFLAS